MVKHLMKYKPGLFNNMPKFEHKVYELNDEEISLLLQENGEYLLAVLPARITNRGEVSGWLLFKRGRFGMGGSCSHANCKGTKGQIIDFCLLQLADNPGRHEPGTGEINYDNLFRFIDEAGYEGWIGCEYKPSGKTEDGLAWAQKYLV